MRLLFDSSWGSAELETPLYRQALYIAVAVMATIYIVRLIGRTGQRIDRPTARAAGLATEATSPVLLSSTEVRRASCELARDAFRQLTGSSDPQSWAISVKDIEIDSHFFRRQSVRLSLRRLRKLASKADRTHVSQRDLKHLAKQVAGILDLHRQGRLRHPLFVT